MEKILSQASPHKSKAQYMSAVWANSPAQAEAAQRVAAKQKKSGVPILSAKDTQWWEAEEYHRESICDDRTRDAAKRSLADRSAIAASGPTPRNCRDRRCGGSRAPSSRARCILDW